MPVLAMLLLHVWSGDALAWKGCLCIRAQELTPVMKVCPFISVRPAEVRGMVVASVRMRVLAFMMVVGGSGPT